MRLSEVGRTILPPEPRPEDAASVAARLRELADATNTGASPFAIRGLPPARSAGIALAEGSWLWSHTELFQKQARRFEFHFQLREAQEEFQALNLRQPPFVKDR